MSKLDAKKRCKRCGSTRADLDDYQTIFGRIYAWYCKNVSQCQRRARLKRQTRHRGEGFARRKSHEASN